jgi:ABC-type sugar transport system permease subunit
VGAPGVTETSQVGVGVTPNPVRRLRRQSALRTLTPYLFLAPAVAVLALVYIYPVLSVIVSSFLNDNTSQAPFAGLGNYRLLFGDNLFWTAITNNLRLFIAVPIMAVLSLLIAAVLHDHIKGWRFYRSIIFMPYILATAAIGIVFSYIFQYRGALNMILSTVGLGGLTQDWLGDPHLAIWVILVVIVWQQIGFGAVLFLARLSSVDQSLYEAALVDQANWWQRLWHITVPQLATVLEFYITISLITMLSWVFNYVYVMTGGGPSNSTYVLEYLIYEKAFREGLYDLASAVSCIVLLVAIVILCIQWFIRRRVEVMM